MPNYSRVRFQIVAFCAAIILVVLAINFIDDGVARSLSALTWSRPFHTPVLGSPVLVVLACLTIVAGALRAATGHPLGRLMQVLVIASFSLVWSVCVDEFVLKYIFGRETPDEYLKTGVDAFHWFQGSPTTSFPSGHAVQIMSVGAVFLMAYPKQRPIGIVIMSLALTALVLGNWHFVSDVVAGCSFGFIGAGATFGLWNRSQGATR